MVEHAIQLITQWGMCSRDAMPRRDREVAPCLGNNCEPADHSAAQKAPHVVSQDVALPWDEQHVASQCHVAQIAADFKERELIARLLRTQHGR